MSPNGKDNKSSSGGSSERTFLRSLPPLSDARRRSLKAHLSRYASADDVAAYRLLGLHTVLWLCTYPLYAILPTPLWVLLKAGMVVRSFILFHDMTHGSFFSTPALNRRFGFFTSLMCMTPFEDWGKNHKRHHDIFGDLSVERFDGGNTTWFTKQWVMAWPFWKRAGFYVIRDPILVYFWLVPLQWGLLFHFRKGGLSTCLGLVVSMLSWHGVVGLSGVIHEAMALCLGAAFGVYLFHLQHSVNPAYRVHVHDNHDKFLGSLYGSTFLHLHPLLKFFTLGIEYHHIHHASTRVPCYKIQQCHDQAAPGLWDGVVHVDTLEKYVVSTFHTLWDDEKKSLVTFPWYQMLLTAVGFNEPKENGRQHYAATVGKAEAAKKEE